MHQGWNQTVSKIDETRQSLEKQPVRWIESAPGALPEQMKENGKTVICKVESYLMSHRIQAINNGWPIDSRLRNRCACADGDSPFPMAYCCSRSIMLMWVTPRRSCISVSQWVTLPLPGPPSTKITGTFGGSNLTFPVLCIPAPALIGLPPPSVGDRTMAERMSPPLPPPFQSDSSTSCVVLLLSGER